MQPGDRQDTDIWAKRLKKNADIVSRTIAEEMFLVPIKGNLADMERIFTLNQVAEYIWQHIGEEELAAIRDGILAYFDVEKEQAESDIREFVNELLEAGLISE